MQGQKVERWCQENLTKAWNIKIPIMGMAANSVEAQRNRKNRSVLEQCDTVKDKKYIRPKVFYHSFGDDGVGLNQSILE